MKRMFWARVKKRAPSWGDSFTSEYLNQKLNNNEKNIKNPQ